jgi:hypothetical protein
VAEAVEEGSNSKKSNAKTAGKNSIVYFLPAVLLSLLVAQAHATAIDLRLNAVDYCFLKPKPKPKPTTYLVAFLQTYDKIKAHNLKDVF